MKIKMKIEKILSMKKRVKNYIQNFYVLKCCQALNVFYMLKL